MNTLRTYTATVEFTDSRRKPRTITVQADSRSAARRAARTAITAQHPDWAITQVTARTTSCTAPAAAPAPAVPAAPKQRDPLKVAAQAAADAAMGITPGTPNKVASKLGRGTSPWWTAYRAETARQRANAEAQPSLA